jgi:LmbE family N-acetylglucosaminyl deacetylase
MVSHELEQSPVSETQTPRRVLAVMAHPDDSEFMAGGVLARWARAGASLHLLLLTDGASGSRDPAMSHEALTAIRQDEQRAAAAALGGAELHFLGYPDGRLVATIELRLAIARVIRLVRPDTVITCDPRFYYSDDYINHPDHRAAGEATLAAIMPIANTRLAAPELLAEGLEPHDVPMIYLAIPEQANCWLPISEEDAAAQIAALRAHASQVGDWDFEPMVREFLRGAAEEARAHGIACELAEAFRVIRLSRPDPAAPLADEAEGAAQGSA